MKRFSILVVLCVALSGCSATWNHLDKGLKGLSSGDYTVTVYSCGTAVRTYDVKNGFINTEQNSDGYYWIQDGKLIRVSGTVIIEQK